MVREIHKLPRQTKIAGGTFFGIFLILVISLFYIPAHSHSGRIIPFADDGNFASGGKWSPDGKQLIVSTVFIAGNVLLSLNMVEILAEKGIKM